MINNCLKSTAFVLLLSFLIAFDVYGQNQELSVDEVLAIFYQRNLDLIAAQYNIDQGCDLNFMTA